MRLGRSGARVDVVATSGILRVTVSPSPNWFWMLSEAAFLVVFEGYTARGWAAMSVMSRLIFAWVTGAAIVA
jgi:hypothetical protein